MVASICLCGKRESEQFPAHQNTRVSEIFCVMLNGMAYDMEASSCVNSMQLTTRSEMNNGSAVARQFWKLCSPSLRVICKLEKSCIHGELLRGNQHGDKVEQATRSSTNAAGFC